MRQQINSFQTKQQDKNTQKQLTEEIGNLPEKEFRVMIAKMTQDLGKWMKTQIKKLQKKKLFNKELEDLKNKPRWIG